MCLLLLLNFLTQTQFGKALQRNVRQSESYSIKCAGVLEEVRFKSFTNDTAKMFVV